MKRFASYILFLFGLSCLGVGSYIYWQQTVPKNLSFSGTIKTRVTHTHSVLQPVELLIPSLDLDLPIIPAKITRGIWETTTQGVSFLTSSSIPGEMGNSILYGHNFLNILGKLPRTHPGEEIEVRFSDSSVKKFTIKYTSIVSPNQIGILQPSHDDRITLYTCTGFFDSQRFVVVAILNTPQVIGYNN